MLFPLDGWTIAHSFAGFFFGRINFNRWLFYPVPIGWEIYQLYFHYQPQGYYFAYIWLNSLVDILACLICYEIATRHSFKYERHPFWLRISVNQKAATAYALITIGITWAFWDDIFRRGLSARVPSIQVPLVIGAFSPIIASFVLRRWINREVFYSNTGLTRISFKQFSYYMFAGFLPTAVIYMIIVLVTGF